MSETRDVTRRDVVKAAGAVTVAAAAAKIQGAPAIMKVRAANDQAQYGFIGTGSRGTYLLKHLAGIDNGRCVAICDVVQDNMDKAAQVIGSNPKKYKDYRELLGDKNVDAVLIAVPLYEHFPVTKDALLAGKHVFCEKSLVFKPNEVHELRALAAQHPKQILQVGLQRRYSKYYQTVKAMIDKGALGEVTHIRAQWHRNTSWRKPVKDPSMERVVNWRMYKDLSGGLTGELASHQIDVADWMFGARPEYVVGVGGLDHWKDGRTIYDNIALIYRYPKGQKLLYSSIQTNAHLDILRSERQEFGEIIMGTAGTIHITIGTDEYAPTGLWFREPSPAKVAKPGEKKEAFQAGATIATGAASKPLPIILERDQMTGNESFLEREMKFGRRWLYSKGVMVPEEDRNPVDNELMSFLDATKSGKRPLADVEVGLADSTAVILSNMAMDEERKVMFTEIDKMGHGGDTGKAAPAKHA